MIPKLIDLKLSSDIKIVIFNEVNHFWNFFVINEVYDLTTSVLRALYVNIILRNTCQSRPCEDDKGLLT